MQLFPTNFIYFLSVVEVMVEEVRLAVVVAHLVDLDVLTGEEFLLDSLVAMEKVEFHHSQLNRKDGIWPEVIYLKISQNFLLRFLGFKTFASM